MLCGREMHWGSNVLHEQQVMLRTGDVLGECNLLPEWNLLRRRILLGQT
jgi:hypothetical protein